MTAGAVPGLQIRVSGRRTFRGVFDSHTLPPNLNLEGEGLNTFDVVVLILILAGGFAGFQKGLITGLSRLIGKIAAIGIAAVFHQQFLKTVEPLLGLKKMIEPKIAGILTKIVESKLAATGVQGANSKALAQPVITQATASLTNYILEIGSLFILFILVTLILNVVISFVMAPLAKTLSFADRGGGFVFGALSMMVGVCLFAGLFTPVLTTGNIGLLKTSNSLFYPWLIQGYDFLHLGINAFAGDILKNPLEGFPIFKGTPV